MLIPCNISIERGMTSNEIQSICGNLPTNERRMINGKEHERQFVHNVTGESIKEWTPSNYFNSIKIADDEHGPLDVVKYGIHTGQYYTCCISESNMKRALIKRIIYNGKKHKFNFPGICNDVEKSRDEIIDYLHKEFIPKYITPLKPGYTFETAQDEWLSHAKRYTQKTKENLRKMLYNIRSGNYEAKYHGKDDPLGLRVINIFQKNENYVEPKEPRAISPCSQEVKALLGGFYHLIDQHAISTCPFFVKTLNPYQIRNKMNQMSANWSCFMGSDYSSYEGSQDYYWLCNIELAIYEKWLQNYPEVYEYIHNIYSSGHDLYYRHRYLGHLYGKRMSGDMQTSIGNGICNALIWSFVSHKMGINIEFLVEGDDAFICSDKPLDTSIVNNLGFDCKLEGPSCNPDDISFLSMYRVNNNYFGNIPKLIDKIGVVKSTKIASAIKRNSNRAKKLINDYNYTKAYCFKFMFPNTPVISALCDCVMRNSGGKFNIKLMEDYYVSRLGSNIKIPKLSISNEVRKRVSELWPQYSIAKQLRLEESFNNFKGDTGLILDVLDI